MTDGFLTQKAQNADRISMLIKTHHNHLLCINLLRLGDAYMHQTKP